LRLLYIFFYENPKWVFQQKKTNRKTELYIFCAVSLSRNLSEWPTIKIQNSRFLFTVLVKNPIKMRQNYPPKFSSISHSFSRKIFVVWISQHRATCCVCDVCLSEQKFKRIFLGKMPGISFTRRKTFDGQPIFLVGFGRLVDNIVYFYRKFLETSPDLATLKK
jgi:hypothetical protein